MKVEPLEEAELARKFAVYERLELRGKAKEKKMKK